MYKKLKQINIVQEPNHPRLQFRKDEIFSIGRLLTYTQDGIDAR